MDAAVLFLSLRLFFFVGGGGGGGGGREAAVGSRLQEVKEYTDKQRGGVFVYPPQLVTLRGFMLRVTLEVTSSWIIDRIPSPLNDQEKGRPPSVFTFCRTPHLSATSRPRNYHSFLLVHV